MFTDRFFLGDPSGIAFTGSGRGEGGEPGAEGAPDEAGGAGASSPDVAQDEEDTGAGQQGDFLDALRHMREEVAEVLRYVREGSASRYAAQHAPAGGVDIGGKHYTGGEFIPAEVVAGATEEEKGKLAGSGSTDTGGATHSDSQIDEAQEDWDFNGVHAKAFKNWFGDWEKDPRNASRVVDKAGKPLIVHHGAAAKHPSFKTMPIRSTGASNNDDRRSLDAEAGFFFTPSRQGAEKYADFAAWDATHDQNSSGYVGSVFLNIRNPIVIDAGADEASTLSNETIQRVIEARRSGKHDGACIRGSGEAGNGFDKPNVWIAFMPSQIKSIENRGTFDPNDAVLQHARVADAGPAPSTPTPYARMSAAIAHYHATGQPEMAKRLVDAYSRRSEAVLQYGWQRGTQVGTGKRGEPIYRWTGTDVNAGDSRTQSVEPGTGRQAGQQGEPAGGGAAQVPAIAPAAQGQIDRIKDAAKKDLSNPDHPMIRLRSQLTTANFGPGEVRTIASTKANPLSVQDHVAMDKQHSRLAASLQLAGRTQEAQAQLAAAGYHRELAEKNGQQAKQLEAAKQSPPPKPVSPSSPRRLVSPAESKSFHSWMASDKPLVSNFGRGNEDIRGGVSDHMLADLNKESGYDGKAEVVSKGDLDKHIADGEIELYRGTGSPEFAQQFIHGDFYAGVGISGNGTYTARGTRSEFGYEDKNHGLRTALEYANGNHAGLNRMTLKRDAKIVKKGELLSRMVVHMEQLEKEHETADPARQKQITREMTIIADPGRYATMHGYDAIDVDEVGYMVVLNRTMCRVQKEAIEDTRPKQAALAQDDDDGIDLGDFL